MTDRWPKSAKIVACTLACLLGASLTLYEASSLRAWYVARQLGRHYPNLSLTPIPLPDSRVAELGGARIERLGISMQSPWKVIESEKQANFPGLMALNFAEGQVAIFHHSHSLDKPVKHRVPSIERRIITRVLGGKWFKSRYDLLASEVYATPSQARWWGTRSSNVRNTLLLTMKLGYVGSQPTVVYSIHIGSLRGFQVGNPAVRPFDVRLALFDQRDRRYDFLFSGRDRDHPVLSQAQINAFVASIRPLPVITALPASNKD
jgi:hypothetical protein